MRKTAIALAVVGALAVAANAQAEDVWGMGQVTSVDQSSHQIGDVTTTEGHTDTAEGHGKDSVFGGLRIKDDSALQKNAETLKKITETSVTVNGGNWDKVVGGNNFKVGVANQDGTAFTTPLKSSTVVVNGGQIYQMAGGSFFSGSSSDDKISLGNNGTTNVTINGGSFGADKPLTNVFEQWVIAGDMAKFGAASSAYIDSDPVKSVLDTTTMEIYGGTFNSAVVGGSAAHVYYANSKTGACAEVGTSNLTIYGGTFNHAVTAAGLAMGHNSTSKVGTANLTITKTEGKELSFGDNAGIYAGGIVDSYATEKSKDETKVIASEVTTSNITINNATVGNIYGTTGYAKIYYNVSGEQNRIEYTTTDGKNGATYVKTNLTLNGATAGTVQLGVDSVLTVAGKSTVKTLQLDGENVTVKGDNGTLTYTTGNFNTVTLGGTLTLNGTVNGTANIVGTVKTVLTGTGTFNVATGGTLIVSTKDALASQVKLSGGTLQAASSVVFVTENQLIADNASAVTTSGTTTLNTKVSGTSGTLAISDSGVYTTDSFGVMKSVAAAKNLSLVVLNAKSAESIEYLEKDAIKTNDTTVATVTTVADKKGTLSVDSGKAGGATIKVSADVETVELKPVSSESENNTVVAAGTTSGGALFTNAKDEAVDSVGVGAGVTLQLGHADKAEETQGTLTKLVVGDADSDSSTGSKTAKVVVTNIAAQVNEVTLKEGAEVSIGTSGSDGKSGKRGELVVSKLDMAKDSKIFLDPVWEEGQGADAGSWLVVTDSSTVGGKIAVGANSVATFGTGKSETLSAIEDKLNLNWGTDVTAALYVGTPITLTELAGSVHVDGSMTTSSTTDSNRYVDAGKVVVAGQGLLAVNQKAIGNGTAITGAKVTFKEGSLLGIVNAEEGTFTLASDGVEGESLVKVVTDTPFVTGSLSSDGKLTNTFSAEGGLGALASTGIQSMTQRANDNFLMTIADRTALDQATPATNLWVDVTGERYEADKLDNNGSFRADMGYGAFGGDFALTDDLSAGAAVQYGKGTLRSNVSSIKNSIENYGVALYGAWTAGDAKITAEATYVKSENDIKSSQKALEKTVDADVWSVGVTGQMKFEAGAFRFVPSIGVRVSQLSTEGYNVGSTKIDRETQTYVQVPLALRMSGKLDTVAGWNIAPAAMIAYVPTFGDTDISVLGHDQDVLDKSPVQGRFGIRAQNGGLLLNADLLAGGGKDGRSAIGGKVGLRYTF